jgi:nucleotide-binding universal stress UspA family protein
MKLLVVTDLEESSDAFLATARNWAARFADWVWIVHVEDPDPAFVGYEAGPREVRDAVAREIREHHRRLETEADRWRETGIDTTALVIQGPVVETILAEADKVEADAIVMGAPSHSRWHDLLLGNVADSLIRKSRCPVLVIPQNGGSPD